jgi:hypothetical protein
VSVPSLNWDPPSPASDCIPPPEPKGEGPHSPAGEGGGGGGPNSEDYDKMPRTLSTSRK